MLSHLQRERLQAFVERSPKGTGFLQRVQIVLLADEGMSQEEIAAELEVPIVRVRQFLRAFHRQGTNLFPEHVLAPEPIFSPDMPMSGVSRAVMKDLLDGISSLGADLQQSVGQTAVHESRKSVRSLRTALRLFEPYFEAGELGRYRKRFRKVMRRMGPSRDFVVFEAKLRAFIDEVEETNRYEPAELANLRELQEHWADRLDRENKKLKRFLDKGAYDELLAEFGSLLAAEAPETDTEVDWSTPTRARHLIPVIIARELASLRSYDHALRAPTPELLHRVRIRAKNLRYTIEFFEPVLGPTVADALSVLKELLLSLGDLNDMRVARELLDHMSDTGLSKAIGLYREVVGAEIDRLTGIVLRNWETVETSSWRLSLAKAVVTL